MTTASLELNKILLNRIEIGDKTPIKKIVSYSGNKEIEKVFYNFIPLEYDYKDQFTYDMKPVPAFEGVCSEDSYKLELETNIKKPIIHPTLFIDNVIYYEL